MKKQIGKKHRTDLGDLVEGRGELGAAELRLVAGAGGRLGGALGTGLGGGLGGVIVDRTHLITMAATTGAGDPSDVAED